MLTNKLMPKVNVPNTDYQMKMVPGMSKSGYLDPNAKKELIDMQKPKDPNEKQPTTMAEVRKTLGWKTAHHDCQNKLEIVNTTIKGVPVRMYVQETAKDETLPVILFIHGGGFFGGDLDNVEYPCEALADFEKLRVVSVDYSLAPENPYPQDVIDCYQVLNYLGQNKADMKVSDITVMGDSAGGNLTYVLSLLDRQAGTNYIDKAVSLYPVTYLGTGRPELRPLTPICIKDDNPESIKAYLGSFQSDSTVHNTYVDKSDPESMYLSPLNAPEELLKKLPKTLFMVGEFDPLRLQGEAFYNKMKLAGGDITYIRYNGMIHAFMDKVGDFPQADDAMLETMKFVLE